MACAAPIIDVQPNSKLVFMAKSSESVIRLRNLTAGRIVFKTQTTRQYECSLKPNMGILGSGEETSLLVLLLPQTEQKRCKILIQAALHRDDYPRDDISAVFRSLRDDDVHKFKLECKRISNEPSSPPSGTASSRDGDVAAAPAVKIVAGGGFSSNDGRQDTASSGSRQDSASNDSREDFKGAPCVLNMAKLDQQVLNESITPEDYGRRRTIALLQHQLFNPALGTREKDEYTKLLHKLTLV
jgi:hypothetical protein